MAGSHLKVFGLTELTTALSSASNELGSIISRATDYFKSNAIQMINEEIISAAAYAGEDAFPRQYLYGILEHIPGILITEGNSLVLDFDELGTYAVLTTAFHYGARLSSGGTVELPWHGGGGDSGLKNEVDKRYDFWSAVHGGYRYRNITTTGLWPETIAARVDQWNSLGKAPQWLFLQYGQEEWEPTIDPSPIVENITDNLYSLWRTILQGELDALIDQINDSKPGVRYEPRGRGAKLRGPLGRFISLEQLQEL